MAKWVQHPANWKGGRVNDNGYHMTYVPTHPRASNGYVRTHILIAEKALGRLLPSSVQVHHARGVSNNKYLVICEDDAYHRLLHQRTRAYRASGSVTAVKCRYCKKWNEVGVKEMYTPKIPSQSYHRSCIVKAFRKGGLYAR
jgi:hypothetical protein